MKGLLAEKLVMTQAITQDGSADAITILKAEPNVITQVKQSDKDGYFALQLGLPQKMKKRDKAPVMRAKREFRFPEYAGKPGDQVKVGDVFAVGDRVDVIGITKGRGFAGTIKRHHFHRGPMTHGHDHHRAPGSIGAMGIPRVEKGRRMSGHLGNVQVTIKNLKIMAIDSATNLLAVSGGIPGAPKQIVMIRKHE
ncbi:MAG: 50S ribosomal protein L3 [bacterium]